MKTHKILQHSIAAVLSVGAVLSANHAYACGTDVYLGSVCVTAGAYCPDGYTEAGGQIMSIAEYSALYALFGTAYGGDGISTFGLPDLRGRSAVGLGRGPGMVETVYRGDMRGYEKIPLSIANLPPHIHSATFTPSSSSSATGQMQVSTADGTVTSPENDQYYLGASAVSGMATPSKIYTNDGTTLVDIQGLTVSGGGGSGTVTVGSTGSGEAVYNIPPQLGLRYCIAIEGMFPPRPD